MARWYTALFFIFNLVPLANSQPKAYNEVLLIMGSRFEVTAISDNETLAKDATIAAIAEAQRIEQLISSWQPTSQTSEINRQAGKKPVKVDKELFDLIKRAKKISALTEGAFDISFASIDKVWKFDGTMTALPSEIAIAASVSKINYQNIILDENNGTVFLKEEGMKIGFGGIGQGYVANRCRKVMQEMGIASGVVNVSGDIITWGKELDGTEWKIAIGDPSNTDRVLAWLTVGPRAVVTSGNYEKFVTINGEKYSHIINPKTGYPVRGLKSVTVISPDPEISDALSTGVFVLGREKGLSLVNQLKGIEVIMVDVDNKIWTSDNLNLNYYDDKKDLSNELLIIGNEKN